MSQNLYIASGITSAALAAGYLLWRNGCKKREQKNNSRNQRVQRELIDTKLFPDTSILTQHADANRFAELRCGPNNDAELASLLEQLLTEMKFNKVTLPNTKNTEKEFQFGLERGDSITVLSGISTDEKKVFSRKTV